jgi:uncharacterized glyoxalase superfamily protein PhnB
VRNPERVARFWCEVLGYVVPSPPAGFAKPKSGKNRMHLDLQVLDVEAEVQRLVAAGARVR